MPVPEAAMHEDDGVQLGKNEIRSTGEILSMQAKAIAAAVQFAADDQFGLCIRAMHAAHDRRPLRRGEHVGHGMPPSDAASKIGGDLDQEGQISFDPDYTIVVEFEQLAEF